MSKNYKIVLVLLIINLSSINAYCLICPIRRDQNNSPLLTNCEEIRLVSQVINLYHHPLGIWIIRCISKFHNLYSKKILQEMAFNSGFDIKMIEDKLYCDEFNNFRIFIDGKELENIRMKERCPNYVDRIGIDWTINDNTGIGFLNTWQVEFKPEEIKKIEVTFNFIINKPPIVFKPHLNESWYVELMTWMRHEYSKQAENDFILPLNMGSFWALFLDSLIIQTYNSKEWFLIEDKSKIVYDPENVIIYTFSKPVGFFSPPAIELSYLTEKDLKNKTKTELNLLRNSFFAKYGRKFDVKWLKLYFKKQPWYYENPNYDNWYLTDFDIQNIKYIFQYEKQRKLND